MQKKTNSRLLLIGSGHMAWAGVRGELRGECTECRVVSEREAEEAIGCAERLQPEEILVEAPLPGVSVARLVGALNACCPASRVLVLGELLAEEERRGLDECMVQAYVTWEDLHEGTVRRLVRNVREDDLLVGSKAVLVRVREAWQGKGRRSADVPALSAQERQILERVVRGKAYKQIKHEAGIAVRTVNVTMATLRERLDASTNAALVYEACRLGLLEPRLDGEEHEPSVAG